ncbi:MAG TPA: metallophosphoesterase family protein [Armatimonadota bacterium]|nr:metallophosphoesterase family protein [Armatimonadota bacterium]
MRIGVIADTHGKVLPEVFTAFSDVSLIFHAGDIGSDAVISELETIARVVAVRGNVDVGFEPPLFPDTRRLRLEGVDIFLCHQPERALNLSPMPDLVIHGHTHRTRDEQIGTTRWFNPGTAGKPKIAGLYTVGLLTLENGHIETEIITMR